MSNQSVSTPLTGLDPGTTYTLSQSGADTVVDMGGGDELILKKVQLSTLAPGWIFTA